MAEKQRRWVVYYDDTFLMKMNRLREEYAKKYYIPVDEVSVSEVVKSIAEEKYVEYVDKTNNRARITNLAEGQSEMKRELIDLRLQVAQLTSVILRLMQAIERMEGDGR